MAYNNFSKVGDFARNGLASFFMPWNNPSEPAMDDINKIPGMEKPYYAPYIDAGNFALPKMEENYNNLTSNPGDFLNQIMQGYRKSPGFDFALKQALGGANHAAAAGGMAGSPQHEMQNEEIATNLSNQDISSWLTNAMSLFSQGNQGMQYLGNKGFDASDKYADLLGNNQMAKSKTDFLGTDLQNQHDAGNMEAIMNALKSVFGL